MVRGRVVSVVALGALLGLVAGCGSSSDSGGEGTSAPTSTQAESPAPPSKGEYIKRADAVCTKAKALAVKQVARAVDLDQQIQASTDPAARAKLIHRSADVSRSRTKQKRAVTDQLEALEAPAGGPASAFLAARVKQAKLGDQISAAVDRYGEKLDQATADAVGTAVQAANDQAKIETKTAEKFGFKVCGKPLK